MGAVVTRRNQAENRFRTRNDSRGGVGISRPVQG